MNGEELLNVLEETLKEHEVSSRDFAWNDLEETTRDAIKLQLGDFKYISLGERTEGGGDWDGAQTVCHFKDHNIFIALTGYYSSDDGCDFSCSKAELVEPVEVKTILYVPVKKNSSQAW